MDNEDERKLICNNCIHNFVIDKENFMFVFCEKTLFFCYSIHLPEYELAEEGDTCNGKWFERRPIWEVQ